MRSILAMLGFALPAAAAPEPDQRDIDAAIATATTVRDSTLSSAEGDDKYRDVAAAFVVEEVDVRRELEYARYERTKGARGVKKRTALEETGEGDGSKVVVVPIPDVVMNGIKARDEYIARVPPEKDTQKNSILYAFDNADVFFVYGRFAEARERFERIYGERGAGDAWGLKAWEKLVSIAAKSHEVDRAEALAHANPSSELASDVLRGVAYVRADRAFVEACGSDNRCNPVTPDNKAAWANVAQRYEAALAAGPARKEAPRAAMRAAFARKQIHDYRRAIDDYELFVRAYGATKLDAEGTGYLQLAYDELATTYYGVFDYAKAASTYDMLARGTRFDPSKRTDAARNALLLFRAFGDRDKVLAEHQLLSTFAMTPEERASVDYIAADAGHTLASFYAKNKDNPAAATYALEAAWKLAKQNGNRVWLEATVAAWRRVKSPDANAAPFAEYGAEAELALLDDEIRGAFDYETGHLRYVTMSVQAIPSTYALDAQRADAYERRLDHVVRTYASPTFAAAAIARQGSLYDSLRSGLYECGGSKFEVVPPELERVLARMRASGNATLVARADAIEDGLEQAWVTKRDHEIDTNDAIMVRRYAQAWALAKAHDVTSPAVTRALQRLAHYTNIIGDAKMRAYVNATPDPTDPAKLRKLVYLDGMFLRAKPGLTMFPPMP